MAIGAVFSLGIAGLYLAYLIPIAARWLGGEDFKPGPFSLGIFVRITSCLLSVCDCNTAFFLLVESPHFDHRSALDDLHARHLLLPHHAHADRRRHELHLSHVGWINNLLVVILLLSEVWRQILVHRPCGYYRECYE